VYLSGRRGIAQFDLFVRTREAMDLLGDVARLSPVLPEPRPRYRARARRMLPWPYSA
jgi:hypothetical protein